MTAKNNYHARINGALSLGPVTAASNTTSARNSLKHPFAAKRNLLPKKQEEWLLQLEGHRESFRPAVSIEKDLPACYNHGRQTGLADGIVITPSHNPPRDGGFKYSPPTGGPAETTATKWVENGANRSLAAGLAGVKRLPLKQALASSTTLRFDYLSAYVDELAEAIDFDAIRSAGLKLGVDPLGGAGLPGGWGIRLGGDAGELARADYVPPNDLDLASGRQRTKKEPALERSVTQTPVEDRGPLRAISTPAPGDSPARRLGRGRAVFALRVLPGQKGLFGSNQSSVIDRVTA